MENNAVADSNEGIHIYQPEKILDDGLKPIDIVAVHGLGGHRHNTWKHSDGHHWLSDPQPDGPDWGKNTRIMTFGYCAGTSKNLSERVFTVAEALLSDLSDWRINMNEKNRSIIFIGHSLGGIIIKAALIHAYIHRTQFLKIFESTKAIVFFATPHQGSSREKWLEYSEALANAVDHDSQLLQGLEIWSSELVERMQWFNQIAPEFDITTFFEMAMPGSVNEGSARIGLRKERAVGLNATHKNICQLSPQDPSRRNRVLRRLEAIIWDIREKSIQPSSQELKDCMVSSPGHHESPSRRLDSDERVAEATDTWLRTHTEFKGWKSENSGRSKILLVTGKLGYTSRLAEVIAVNLQGNAVILPGRTLSANMTQAQVIANLLYAALIVDSKAPVIGGSPSLAQRLGLTDMYHQLKRGNNSFLAWPLGHLQDKLESLLWFPSTDPVYLIVDGLDEAIQDRVSEIVKLLVNAADAKHNFKFHILVTSRTEELRSSFPSDIYHLSLDNVDNDGQRIFRWLRFAEKPLTLDALRDISTVGPEAHLSPPSWGKTELNRATHHLVDTEDGVCRLVSYAPAIDYLMEKIKNWSGQSDADRSSHSQIARDCLKYLVNRNPDQNRQGESGSDEFLEYASRYWSAHLDKAADDMRDLLRELADHPKAPRYCELARGEIDPPRAEAVKLIHIASELGHARVVKQLLSGPHHLDSKDNRGRTPLLLATINGHEAVVKVLLSQTSININEADDDDRTPLSVAAQHGYDSICSALLEKHADVDKKTNGLKPVFIAAQEGNRTVFKELIKETRNGPDNGTDSTFLHQAAREGSAEAARLFLDEAHIDIDVVDQEGVTPLYLAIQENRGTVASLLYHRGASREAKKSETGKTLLFHALSSGNPRAAEWLLSWEAAKDEHDNDGQTPLHVAAAGSVDDVQLMMDYGASINKKDNLGQTPLHVAVCCGDRAVNNVRLLIKHHADITSRDNNGNTPLHAAAARGSDKIVQVLVRHDGRGTNARNNVGETPLHKAVGSGVAAVVEILLQEGATMTCRDQNGQTPLHVAVAGQTPEIARALITNGADVELRDYKGQSPLHTAAEKGHSAMINLLLFAGANDMARDYNGDKPSRLSETKRHADAVSQFSDRASRNPENADDWYMVGYAALRSPPFASGSNQEAIDRSRKAVQTVRRALEKWDVPPEHIPGLMKLTQYDLVILGDNSESMKDTKKMELLETTIFQVNEIAIQMTGTELSLRLLNDDVQQSKLTTAGNRTLIGGKNIEYHGVTPLGTQLKERVIDQILLHPTREKPVITILITDGEPRGETRDTLQKVIKEYSAMRGRHRKSIFLVSQIGNEEDATKFLEEVEQDEEIKHLVFCSEKKLDDLRPTLDSSSSDEDRKYASLLLELFSTALMKRTY